MSRRGATWIRVSSDQQKEIGQVPDIERFCAHHDIEVVKRYVLHDVSAYKGEQEAMLRQVLDDAYRGEFEIVVVWALDRVERRGIERVLKLIRELRERNCVLASVKETWLNGSDATTELLVAIAAWMAQSESARRSERVKMGMARARAEGRQLGGRKPGARNKKPRSDTGTRRALSDEARLSLARANHRRKCPVGGCMETSAHK